MSVGVQPPGMAPAAVFRLLLRAPRPVAPLSYRLAFAPDFALHARALHPLEIADARDDDSGLALVSQSLCDESGEPLLTPEQAGKIDDVEFMGLRGAISQSLGQICPTYADSDVAAWRDVLKRGARAYPSTCVLMSSAESIGAYYGIAPRWLLDGHLMAFQAGREVMQEMTKSHG